MIDALYARLEISNKLDAKVSRITLALIEARKRPDPDDFEIAELEGDLERYSSALTIINTYELWSVA